MKHARLTVGDMRAHCRVAGRQSRQKQPTLVSLQNQALHWRREKPASVPGSTYHGSAPTTSHHHNSRCLHDHATMIYLNEQCQGRTLCRHHKVRSSALLQGTPRHWQYVDNNRVDLLHCTV